MWGQAARSSHITVCVQVHVFPDLVKHIYILVILQDTCLSEDEYKVPECHLSAFGCMSGVRLKHFFGNKVVLGGAHLSEFYYQFSLGWGYTSFKRYA